LVGVWQPHAFQNGWVLHMNGEFECISILSSVEYLCIKSSAFVAYKFQPSPILVCLFHVHPTLPSEVGSFTALSFILLTWLGQIFEKYVHSWIAVTAPFEGKEIHPSSTAVMI
jgi:hypothetical protein